MTIARYAPTAACAEVCFESLGGEWGSMVFPCDSGGQVDLDALTESRLKDYLFARALIGCVFARPRVLRRDGQ